VMRIIKKKANSTKDLQVGFLALNKNGEYGAFAIQQGFSFAVCDNQKQDLIVKGKSHY
ncbi:MAG: glycosylasparaginase, partial [Pedobacter sp.]